MYQPHPRPFSKSSGLFWVASGSEGFVSGCEGFVSGWEGSVVGCVSGALVGTVDGSLTPVSDGFVVVVWVVAGSLGRVGTVFIRSAYQASIKHRTRANIMIKNAKIFRITIFILSVRISCTLMQSIALCSALHKPTRGAFPRRRMPPGHCFRDVSTYSSISRMSQSRSLPLSVMISPASSFRISISGVVNFFIRFPPWCADKYMQQLQTHQMRRMHCSFRLHPFHSDTAGSLWSP